MKMAERLNDETQRKLKDSVEKDDRKPEKKRYKRR